MWIPPDAVVALAEPIDLLKVNEHIVLVPDIGDIQLGVVGGDAMQHARLVYMHPIGRDLRWDSDGYTL